MELATAARRMALVDGGPTIPGWVGNRVYKNTLQVTVDGTGSCALVFRVAPGWATAEWPSSAEFPVLQAMCWADPSRDELGAITEANAEDKAAGLARAVADRIHGVRDQWWGAVGSQRGLLIIDATRYTEPYLVTDRDRHGTLGGDTASNSNPMGDMVYYVAEFALTVVRDGVASAAYG
jgi:hypothetical protein